MLTSTSVVWAESIVATSSSSGFLQFSSVSASGYSRLRRVITSEMGAAPEFTARGGVWGGRRRPIARRLFFFYSTPWEGRRRAGRGRGQGRLRLPSAALVGG